MGQWRVAGEVMAPANLLAGEKHKTLLSGESLLLCFIQKPSHGPSELAVREFGLGGSLLFWSRNFTGCKNFLGVH